MNYKVLYLSLIALLTLPAGLLYAQHCHHHQHQPEPVIDRESKISHYTCGMHPDVRIPPENYEKKDTKCPICFMPLTPVRMENVSGAGLGENVISKVTIKVRELKLAGVKTGPAQKRRLFKEIRAVGKVAYDPQLAVAQDEFISALRSFEKAGQGGIPEITERAHSLIRSSKRKLLLLGLSGEQIRQLEETKKVQQNLVLPEEKMWIYGDVYEYELNWVKEGALVKVKPVGLAGEEFYGRISSINPVVDSQTRSVRFRALVDNPGRTLRPQMYVDVEILSQYRDSRGNDEVLSIPKSALLDTGRRTIVWVDKGNGDFEGRKVKVGPEAIDHSAHPQKYYPVLEGIKAGEMVVTRGNFLIDSQSQITGVAASAYGGALGEEPKGSSQGAHTGHAH
ncbi:MAG: efflux RND transporter periplasmic adaptor subunit [Candidatus Omnitrophica bacterium]|nr:efflux RND transporter periplasmic adaptor subunit [Candidatus Omnitrophota bacterium]